MSGGEALGYQLPIESVVTNEAMMRLRNRNGLLPSTTKVAERLFKKIPSLAQPFMAENCISFNGDIDFYNSLISTATMTVNQQAEEIGGVTGYQILVDGSVMHNGNIFTDVIGENGELHEGNDLFSDPKAKVAFRILSAANDLAILKLMKPDINAAEEIKSKIKRKETDESQGETISVVNQQVCDVVDQFKQTQQLYRNNNQTMRVLPYYEPIMEKISLDSGKVLNKKYSQDEIDTMSSAFPAKLLISAFGHRPDVLLRIARRPWANAPDLDVPHSNQRNMSYDGGDFNQEMIEALHDYLVIPKNGRMALPNNPKIKNAEIISALDYVGPNEIISDRFRYRPEGLLLGMLAQRLWAGNPEMRKRGSDELVTYFHTIRERSGGGLSKFRPGFIVMDYLQLPDLAAKLEAKVFSSYGN